MSEPLISLKNVDLEYELHFDRTNTLKEWVVNKLNRRKYVEKAKDSFLALKEINLDVHEGERVGIIGFNGAGKSTLLKVISGILRPTRGQVVTHGKIQPLIEVGAGFDPEFSGRENIYFNSYMLGFTKAEVDARVDEIIAFADLKEFIDVPVKYYSSGMQVRLAFTIATTIQPEILVLDEMLGAGDVAFVEKAKKRMSNVLEQAKCMVLVSHDLGLVESLCTKVYLLERGKFVYADSAPQAIEQYKCRAGLDPKTP
ncbi:MAG: ABC transporter ATP-binding protein [Bdellovibrionales bacterium]|jgi:ABC-type polysaccharide/polyol phosphate transport system ATPase subunit|nr:ABC transporter ATP-binding protein [Bdellovibrionales bacterium]